MFGDLDSPLDASRGFFSASAELLVAVFDVCRAVMSRILITTMYFTKEDNIFLFILLVQLVAWESYGQKVTKNRNFISAICNCKQCKPFVYENLSHRERFLTAMLVLCSHTDVREVVLGTCTCTRGQSTSTRTHIRCTSVNCNPKAAMCPH